MLTPPPVIVTETKAEIGALDSDASLQKAELHMDRFPLASLAQQGRDSEVLMLGGAPLAVVITVFTAMLGAKLVKLFTERNEIGVNMRSSEGDL